MNSRKILAILVTVVMVFGSFAVSFADDAAATTAATINATFTDTTGHWGAEAIQKWAGNGIISGYEGLFRPDDSITRGEMAVILDNMMDYQKAAKNTFTDLQSGQFYTDAILKANAAGILKGYDGFVRPTDKITKEEAAVMMSRAFAVTDASATKAFLDASAVSDWAKGAVFGMEAKGFVSGFDGYFNPKANITRAEAVTMINNIVKAYYTTAGTYTENVDGTAVIKVPDVVIKDAVISGNVIVAEGVADGNVTFDGKTEIKGDLVVRGGGENSVVIKGDAKVKSVKVEKVGGKVRILADGVVIGEVEATEEVILEGTFTNVTVGADADVVIKGNVTKLDLEKDSKVDVQSGTITTLTVPAGATANIASGATVKTAEITGAGNITGTGKIETANISGDGATIAQTPDKVVLEKDSSATIDGNKVEGEDSKPGDGGGGGGGGDTVKTPSLSIQSMTCSVGGGVVQSGSLYTLPNGATSGNCSIDVKIDNTDSVDYSLSVEIKNLSSTVAYAKTNDIARTYIDALSTYGNVSFGEFARMFDRLGAFESGYYYDEGIRQNYGSSDSNESLFETIILDLFSNMDNGETYTVKVTLTPENGTADTLDFSVQKNIS